MTWNFSFLWCSLPTLWYIAILWKLSRYFVRLKVNLVFYLCALEGGLFFGGLTQSCLHDRLSPCFVNILFQPGPTHSAGELVPSAGQFPASASSAAPGGRTHAATCQSHLASRPRPQGPSLAPQRRRDAPGQPRGRLFTPRWQTDALFVVNARPLPRPFRLYPIPFD